MNKEIHQKALEIIEKYIDLDPEKESFDGQVLTCLGHLIAFYEKKLNEERELLDQFGEE